MVGEIHHNEVFWEETKGMATSNPRYGRLVEEEDNESRAGKGQLRDKRVWGAAASLQMASHIFPSLHEPTRVLL